MIIRQLQYVIALAHTRHFARAAKLCHVSQPSLSTAIQQLEKELGVILVQRGHRFVGFTPEGLKLMPWIRRMLSDWDGLKAEALASLQQVSGVVRIGVIPTALSLVSLVTTQLTREHPGLSLVVLSLASEAIHRQLQDFEIDVGIAYVMERRGKVFRAMPLYQERYMLLCPEGSPLEGARQSTWKEASKLPLCLLTQNMQNRRNVDEMFKKQGLVMQVRMETDSIVALSSAVGTSGLYSIVPHSVVCANGRQPGVVALPLVPELVSPVELLALQRTPLAPAVAALWAVAKQLDLQRHIDADRMILSYDRKK
jgi:DNA-binding transcriptional LysR family regulator